MNWDIIGHVWAVELLREHVIQDHVRHAYLFTGPQGVGRRTLAIRLAQAINCSQPPVAGEACQTCRNCTHIMGMQHPDLAVVQADQIGRTLKVDQIRELQHDLSLAPYEAHFRVAVLLRFEEANPSAANALLKTLEEPPPRVILIVTAESAESLLPTIVSRCEVLRLRPLKLETVSQGLQTRWELPPQQARFLAHLSSGRVGYAIRLHQEPERLEQRQVWLDDHHTMLGANRVKRFAYAEALAKDIDNLRDTLQVWLSFWCDILLRAAGASAPLTNLDRAEEIKNLVSHINLATAHSMVTALVRALKLLDRNTNARLVAEVLMLNLPRVQLGGRDHRP